MKIEFEGWARNSGANVVINKTLKTTQITNNPFPMRKEDIRIVQHDPDTSLRDGVSVRFGTEIKLNGNYLGTISFSTKELMRMLKPILEKNRHSVCKRRI